MKKENLQKIISLRHRLHMFPELSMKETGTSEMLRFFLQRNTGLQVVDRGGWFYAVKRGRPGGGKIAFRADMDALPIPEGKELPYYSRNAGVSHKCGHDGHCAALCGLALELNDMDTEKTVYLIFQPGEETGEGAKLCSGLIREEGISEIYAFHNLGGFPENSIVFREGLTQPASEGMRIRFSGKTSHASAPEEGNNPAEAIAGTVLFAKELSTGTAKGAAGTTTEDTTGESFAKEISAEAAKGEAGELTEDTTGESEGETTGEPAERIALCTVTGIRLGTGDFGISPGEGELCVTLRAGEESVMKRMEEDLAAFARQAGMDAGIRVDFSIQDYFPETRNDSRALSRVLHAAEMAGMQTIRMEHMWRASEDFGWYLKECPGAMIYIGNGIVYPALHTEEYDFNDTILETAVDLFLGLLEPGSPA